MLSRLTNMISYGILGYLLMVNPANAIFNCRTPASVYEEALKRGFDLVQVSYYNGHEIKMIFDTGDYLVDVYFWEPINSRKDIVCLTKEVKRNG